MGCGFRVSLFFGWLLHGVVCWFVGLFCFGFFGALLNGWGWVWLVGWFRVVGWVCVCFSFGVGCWIAAWVVVVWVCGCELMGFVGWLVWLVCGVCLGLGG